MIVVPQGFVLIEQGPLILIVREDYREQLLQCGLDDPERLCARQTDVMHAGRGAMPTIELNGQNGRAVVRKYRRGGLFRFLLPDMFIGRERPFKELDVTLRASGAGVPVAQVVGALSLCVRGPLYRHYLVSRELTGFCDLPTWFQERDAVEEDLAALARCAAEQVRHMHDGGLYHGDLNLKNILVSRADSSRLCIIDWDKSTCRPGPLGLEQRRRNVVRFCRSAEKLRIRGLNIPERFAGLFIEYYWNNSDMANTCRQLLHKALRRRTLFWRFLR